RPSVVGVGRGGSGVFSVVLAPARVLLGGDGLGVDLGVVAGTPLEGELAARALAVEVGAAPVHAAGHEDVVAPGTFQEQVALAVGRHPVVHLPFVDPAFAIRQAFGLLGGGAATTRVGLDLDAVGLRGQLRIGDVGQEAHLAHAGLPAVAEQERGGGPRVLGLVAVVVVDAAGDLAPRLVERLAGAQVDGAAQAAFD